MFCDTSPAGEAMPRAITIAKAGPLPDDEERDDEERDDHCDAMEELNEKAAALRKALPGLSEAQAFERVYSAPENVQLRKRERRQNRPLRAV
jgi:hypothetical protein